MRNNSDRFSLEMHDPDKSLRALWDRVAATAPNEILARIEEARKQFPDIPFSNDVASNAAIFRYVCECYLREK